MITAFYDDFSIDEVLKHIYPDTAFERFADKDNFNMRDLSEWIMTYPPDTVVWLRSNKEDTNTKYGFLYRLYPNANVVNGKETIEFIFGELATVERLSKLPSGSLMHSDTDKAFICNIGFEEDGCVLESSYVHVPSIDLYLAIDSTNYLTWAIMDDISPTMFEHEFTVNNSILRLYDSYITDIDKGLLDLLVKIMYKHYKNTNTEIEW